MLEDACCIFMFILHTEYTDCIEIAHKPWQMLPGELHSVIAVLVIHFALHACTLEITVQFDFVFCFSGVE